LKEIDFVTETINNERLKKGELLKLIQSNNKFKG